MPPPIPIGRLNPFAMVFSLFALDLAAQIEGRVDQALSGYFRVFSVLVISCIYTTVQTICRLALVTW
jgi:hypothetical protein